MDLSSVNKIFNSFGNLKDIFKFPAFKVATFKAASPETVAAFEKTVRSLQAKGLLLPTDFPNGTEEFSKHTSEMHSLGANCIYTFQVANYNQQKLCLLVFAEDVLKTFDITFDNSFNYELLVQKFAANGIPLSQVQEIAGWLHNHGSVTSQVLDRQALEKKLESLMKSCPHGAYVLHTSNKALTLSRLCPQGRIEHLIVNLQKQIGCYTIEEDGKELAATRTQFKRRLQQMGTPLRLINR